jgi:hypothetical protein
MNIRQILYKNCFTFSLIPLKSRSWVFLLLLQEDDDRQIQYDAETTTFFFLTEDFILKIPDFLLHIQTQNLSFYLS